MLHLNLIEKLLIKVVSYELSNYIITNGELHNVDELAHWKYIKREKQADGTWKYYYDKTGKDNNWNRQTKKFERAIYKADKLQEKVDKANAKVAKATEKYVAKQTKAINLATESRNAKTTAENTLFALDKAHMNNVAAMKAEQAQKQQARASKAAEKLRSEQAKAEKKKAKLDKYIQKMEKKFSKTKMSLIDHDVLTAGEEYVYMLMKR